MFFLQFVYKCGVVVDSSRTHGLDCASAGKANISVTGVTNNLIRAAISTAGLPSRLGTVGLARDNGKRHDGATLLRWRAGKVFAGDFPNTLAGSYVNSVVAKTGEVVHYAEKDNRKKYDTLNTRMYEIFPIAVETIGALGPDACDFSKVPGKKTEQITGDKQAGKFLLQRINAAIQCGDATRCHFLTSLFS